MSKPYERNNYEQTIWMAKENDLFELMVSQQKI